MTPTVDLNIGQRAVGHPVSYYDCKHNERRTRSELPAVTTLAGHISASACLADLRRTASCI
jgi:hypothetical protein